MLFISLIEDFESKIESKRLIHVLFNNIKMSIYWSIFVLKLVYFDF